jgi:hypothetical protein
LIGKHHEKGKDLGPDIKLYDEKMKMKEEQE